MLRLITVLAFLLVCPISLLAQSAPAPSSAEAEVRDAIQKYDAALKAADAAAVEHFWADEYVFINPRGEKLSRADRVANLKTGKTAFNSLEHDPKEDKIQIYGNGDVAVYTTLLTIAGSYGGKTQQGKLWGTVIWVHRDGRWQQISSQVTPVLKQ
jgi:ketosteroid isomerase-like protein